MKGVGVADYRFCQIHGYFSCMSMSVFTMLRFFCELTCVTIYASGGFIREYC